MHWTFSQSHPNIPRRIALEEVMDRIGRMRLVTWAIAVLCVVLSTSTRADVVTDWNVVALNATTVPANSILQSRALSIVHCAMHDAARAIDRKGAPCAVDVQAAPGTSVETAVATAAYE